MAAFQTLLGNNRTSRRLLVRTRDGEAGTNHAIHLVSVKLPQRPSTPGTIIDANFTYGGDWVRVVEGTPIVWLKRAMLEDEDPSSLNTLH